MLSLQPPFISLDGLTLFRDDVDDRTFYYVSNTPSLVLTDDGKAAISAYAILPKSGVGGDKENIQEAGISFDVELGVSDQQLAAAAEKIEDAFGVSSPILSPAPVHDGTVKLKLAQAGEDPDGGKWFITTGFQPSLTGSNRAALCVRATGEEAQSLVAAIDSGSVPAIVYYSLGIIGMNPVYHARLEADVSRIRHSFHEKNKQDYLFYSKEIEKSIEDMEQSSFFRIEVDEADPDVKAAAMESLLNDLKSRVISELFEEAEAEGDTSTGIVASLGNLITDIFPGKHYRLKDVSETMEKHFIVDLSQRNAKVYYGHTPQSQLKTMIENSGVNMSEVISWIILDELPCFSQSVPVHLAANTFNGSNVTSVVVYARVKDLESGAFVNESCCLTFDSASERLDNSFSFVRKRGVEYEYQYKAEIYLETGSSRIPEKIETGWITADSSYISINPRNFCRNFNINVILDDQTVFEHVQMIKADLALSTEDGESVFAKSYIFRKEEADAQRVSLVYGTDMTLSYKIRLTYYISDAKEHVSESTGDGSEYFVIPNPFERKWDVVLLCKADWEKVSTVFVDTRIFDAEREEPLYNHFQFTSEHQNDKLIAHCSPETPLRKFEFRISVVNNDGTSVSAGWYSHTDNPSHTFFADNVVPERTVRVRLKDPSVFSTHNLSYVKVDVTLDKEGDPFPSGEIRPDGQVVEFSYPFRDGDDTAVFYKFIAKDKDKSTVFKRSKWTRTDNDVIKIEFKDEDIV